MVVGPSMLPAGPFGVWVTFVTGERIHEIDVEVCLMVMFHSWSSDQQEESSVNVESVEDVDHCCASIQSRKVFCSAIEYSMASLICDSSCGVVMHESAPINLIRINTYQLLIFKGLWAVHPPFGDKLWSIRV